MKLLIAFLCLVFSFGCQKPEEKKIDVLVNIAPYAYFVEAIAGNTLKVETLIPSDANPHLYEPTPKQVELASSAKVWFRLGEPQEKKFLKVLKERNPSLLDIDLCYGIPLIHTKEDCHEGHVHEGRDRHVWLSPRLAMYQVKKIAALLIEVFPEHKRFFLQNTTEILAKLDVLDNQIQEQLAPYKNQALLVSHPAFAYFCKEYQLRQLSVECDGKDPRPQNVATTLRLAKEYHVRSVFIQAQYNNKGAELIAKQLSLPVYLVDPYAKNYIDNLAHISSLIAQ